MIASSKPVVLLSNQMLSAMQQALENVRLFLAGELVMSPVSA